MNSRLQTETLAKLACAYSGVAWGLFWFPLRWLGEAGIEGPWISVIFYAVQLVCIAPFILVNPRRLHAAGSKLIITSFFAGGALALYALAVIYTDVIRAMLLYYLTTIWSTLLARWFLKEPITGLRWFAIALAFAGMLTIFGVDIGFPWPRNIGDWMGLGSGLMWAIAAVRLNQDSTSNPVDITFGFFAWGVVVSLLALFLPLPGPMNMPDLSAVIPTLPWLAPVLAIIAVPGALAAMWGARLIDPGIVGILFMTEIIVGTITVAIWAGEPFGVREVTGIAFIGAAGLVETVWDLWKSRTSVTAQTKR